MGCKTDCLDFFTQKIPIVKYEKTDICNLCVGIFKYLLYIIPLVIIIGIVFLPQWHHQQLPVEGSSIAKVKGSLYSTSGDLEMDVQDYTMNQNMPGSFFIATQLDFTQQERCPVQSRWQWCNSKGTTTQQYNLTGIENLTVFIKNWVVFLGGGFRKESFKWSNINAFHDESQIENCLYNSTDEENKYCPVFKIGTILELAKLNTSPMDKGGVINIEFNWVCNARKDKMKDCKPEVIFKRVDNIEVTKEGYGVNFRHANYYGRTSRDLVKAMGIRFIITNTGYGYSFDLIMLVLKVGGMLGYTSVITFGAAFLIEHCQNCRRKRQTNTYDSVEGN